MAQPFKKNFEYAMRSLGLPPPSGAYDSFTKALAVTAAMLNAVKTLGPGATVAELSTSVSMLGAAKGSVAAGSELLGATAALTAAFYVGACVGSLIYATEESTLDLWDDSNYDWAGARAAAAAAAGSAPRFGVAVNPVAAGSNTVDQNWAQPIEAVPVPANACSSGDMSDNVTGWPMSPISATAGSPMCSADMPNSP